MNIFTKIKKETKFSNNEKIIANYILNHPENFINMSVEEICSECFVSTATFYRLCTKLELSGLADLKVKISASLTSYLQENNEFNFDYPITQNQTNYEIMLNIEEDYKQTVIATMNLFNLDVLNNVVSAMKKAKAIDVYTSAGNIYFAQNFKFQMEEIGVNINVPIEEYNQRLSAANSDSSHLAILISFGGRGLMVKPLLNILKKTKTPILLISSTEDNPAREYADYTLYLCSYENHYNKISSFSTRLSLLYILDTLYTCYFKTDYEANQKRKLNSYAYIRESTN